MFKMSKTPMGLEKQLKRLQQAREYEHQPIERVLWREKVETCVMVGKWATMRSLSDIYLPRVKWLEKAL